MDPSLSVSMLKRWIKQHENLVLQRIDLSLLRSRLCIYQQENLVSQGLNYHHKNITKLPEQLLALHSKTQFLAFHSPRTQFQSFLKK